MIDRFEKRALVWEPDSKETAVVTTELRWQPRAFVTIGSTTPDAWAVCRASRQLANHGGARRAFSSMS